MTNRTIVDLDVGGTHEPFRYQFLDSDGEPIDIADRVVGLSVMQLSPVITVREFYYNSPVIEKVNGEVGMVQVNLTADVVAPYESPSIIADQGEYLLVCWAWEADIAEPSYNTFDFGLFDAATFG